MTLTPVWSAHAGDAAHAAHAGDEGDAGDDHDDGFAHVAEGRTADLVLVRRIGLAVLGLQLACLCVWSAVLVHRFALTIDFAVYHQVGWLVGHGHLDSFDSVQGFPFWQGQGEFILWPLGILGDLWPHPVTLLWEQDLALVGAEMVAFTWLCELLGARASRLRGPRWAPALAVLGLLLFVADPWIYWSASFDFHVEPIGVLFVLLAARELWRRPRSRRVWIWAVLALACGNAVTTYVVAVGAACVLAGRTWRRRGAQLLGVSVGWAVMVTTVLGAHKGSGLETGYGYLVAGSGAVPGSVDLPQVVRGIAAHPATVLRVLWSRRLDLYASVGAGGLLGALWPWAVVPVALVLLENGLKGSDVLFIAPSFQNLLVYILVPVGTVALLAALARGRARMAGALAVLVACNAVGWGAVWLPKTVSHWLTVSPGAASTLTSVAERIRPEDEVVVSQGVAGAFSERQWIYAVSGAAVVPVRARSVWAVIAPSQGIEAATVAVSAAWIAEMAGPLHAQLVTHAHGVWAFHWRPPSGTSRFTIPGEVPAVPAWTSPGDAATVTTGGPSDDWRVQATGVAGYVVEGDYWQERAGRYEATAMLSSSVPVAVEVWNATADTLVARREVPATNALRSVTMTVDLTTVVPERAYGGVGPFAIAPVPPPAGDRLEIRVWTPGGGPVSVAWLAMLPVGR